MILIHTTLYVFYIAIFIWLIYRWKFFRTEGLSKTQLILFFLLKVTAGITLNLVYTYYYTDNSKADIYRYFNDSKIISQILFHDARCWWKIMSGIGAYDTDAFSYLVHTQYFSHTASDAFTDNTFIIRVNVLLNYLSFSNIYINTLFFNFSCFIGLTGIFKWLIPYFRTAPLLLSVPVYLLPSVIFWSSGLLKESLLFSSIGLGIYLLTYSDKILPRIVSLLFFFSILFIKPAVFFSLIAASGIYLTLRLFVLNENPFVQRRTRATVVCFWLIALYVIAFKTNIICEKLIDKRNEFVQLAIKENAGSLIDADVLSADCINIISLIPHAGVNSVLRPFVWEKGSAFQRLFAVENSVVLLLLSYLLIRNFKIPERNKLMIAVFLLSFALINYFIIGITVPVTGAIVHYRVIASPFLVIAVLSFISLNKFISKE